MTDVDPQALLDHLEPMAGYLRMAGQIQSPYVDDHRPTVDDLRRLAAALLEARAEADRLREALERISSEDFRGVLPEVIARGALSPKDRAGDPDA